MSSIPLVRLSAAVAYVRTAWAGARPAAAKFWQLLAVIFLLSPSEMKDLEVMPRYDSHLGVGDHDGWVEMELVKKYQTSAIRSCISLNQFVSHWNWILVTNFEIDGTVHPFNGCNYLSQTRFFSRYPSINKRDCLAIIEAAARRNFGHKLPQSQVRLQKLLPSFVLLDGGSWDLRCNGTYWRQKLWALVCVVAVYQSTSQWTHESDNHLSNQRINQSTTQTVNQIERSTMHLCNEHII